MSDETEKLRERMLVLERSRQRERTLRLQAESLLAGLIPLARAEDTSDIFSALVRVLNKELVFDDAVLVAGDRAQLRAVASTSEELATTSWRPGALFHRVLQGHPVSLFDVHLVPEWQSQPPGLMAHTRSALLIPLAGTELQAILICTHSARGAFKQEHIELAKRVGPLAAQCLRNIEQRTREREQQKREREQEAGFRVLIENLPDAIWVISDGKLRYANRALAQILAKDDVEALIGEPLDALVCREDLDAVMTQLEGLGQLGGSTPPREVRLCGPDMTRVPVEIVIMRLRFEGEPAYICVGRDIRERKQLMSRLMQMDRMIAAGTLAAGVGHEINNPLTFLMANTYLAHISVDELATHLKDLSPGNIEQRSSQAEQVLDELRKSLSSIDEAGHRVAEIVRELRTLSPGAPEKQVQPVELLPIIMSAKRMVWSRIRHSACLVEDLQPVPQVMGAPGLLSQVFMNLLNNAALAIEPGAAQDNEIRLTNYQQGDFVVVEVADTGAGISEEHRPHIFDPFFTTRDPDQGTGLGLAISQRTVNSLGGRIEYESEPGVGTTFRVYLPLADEAAVSVAKPTIRDEPTLARKLRAIVIDDEKEIGLAIERLLGTAANVASFQSADEALEFLDADDEVDFILCDLFMPSLSGVEFYRRLEQTHPKLLDRVIFITGGVLMGQTKEFVERLPNRLIYKPFSKATLVDALSAPAT